MDADTNDSMSGIHAGELALNGVVKPDDLQTAIINKDVMLSGIVSSQMPVTSSLAAMTTTVVSVSRIDMPTLAAGKLTPSLTEGVFIGVPSTAANMARVAETAAANGNGDIVTYPCDFKGIFSTMLTNTQSMSQLDAQSSTPQIILAAGTQSSGSLPLQQLLIPVSAGTGTGASSSGTGIQQLISVSVPVGAATATGQMQLLTPPGGQLINVANTPHVNVAVPSPGNSVQPLLMVMPSINPLGTVLVPPNAATVAAAAAAAQNIAVQQQQQQQQATSAPLSQQLLNAQGQVVALGNTQQLLQQAFLAAGQASNPNAKLLACLAQPTSAATSVPQTATPAALISSVNAAAVSSTAGATAAVAGGNKVMPLVPNSASLPVALAAAAANGNISSLTHITPNINQLLPNTISSTSHNGVVVDGVNLDEMREFAKQFKIRRLSLGLTQTQVGQALSVTEGPSYSQSAICRFEKLDITPKSAQKIKPVLERWMAMAEERYKNGVQNLCDFIGLVPSKKRKRRTSFTPQALEILNEYFERSTHPTGAEMTELADKLNFDREVIRVWFCNKRQTLKNSAKRLNVSPPPHSS